MEKDNNNNKLILRFSKIFTNSCRTQDITQVIDHKNPIFTLLTPLTNQIQLQEEDGLLTKPKQPPLMCKPRCPESIDLMVRQNCIFSPRRKITGRYNLLSPVGEFPGRRCPPASPLIQNTSTKKKKKNKNQKPILPNNHPFNLSSSNETDFDFFSSDDEREEEEEYKDAIDKTGSLFSSSKSQSFSSIKSVSISSDSDPRSSGRIRTRVRNRRRRRRRRAAPEKAEVGVVPLQGKVKDSFAVVKSSRDPYSDFRTSMVEMIMEKQIFGSKELENLLQCFLSLNSVHHHRVILVVFNEICDALFSLF